MNVDRVMALMQCVFYRTAITRKLEKQQRQESKFNTHYFTNHITNALKGKRERTFNFKY